MTKPAHVVVVGGGSLGTLLAAQVGRAIQRQPATGTRPVTGVTIFSRWRDHIKAIERQHGVWLHEAVRSGRSIFVHNVATSSSPEQLAQCLSEQPRELIFFVTAKGLEGARKAAKDIKDTLTMMGPSCKCKCPPVVVCLMNGLGGPSCQVPDLALTSAVIFRVLHNRTVGNSIGGAVQEP